MKQDDTRHGGVVENGATPTAEEGRGMGGWY